jgi:hypothetical protein
MQSPQTTSERCYAVRFCCHLSDYLPLVPTKFNKTLEEAQAEAEDWIGRACTVGGDAMIVKDPEMTMDVIYE